jgi:hypothetical protein
MNQINQINKTNQINQRDRQTELVSDVQASKFLSCGLPSVLTARPWTAILLLKFQQQEPCCGHCKF